MRVLIVKTSSLGDVIHTLPALTDARTALPGASFDWLVESAFAEIPRWHGAVQRAISCDLRRWRKHPWRTLRTGEWKRFRAELRAADYDVVIDAQGLVKSAWLATRARGPVVGPDRRSAREPLAAWFYRRGIALPAHDQRHAVDRMRLLLARALNYPEPPGAPDFGLARGQFAAPALPQAYAVLLHATTWPSKCWPESSWRELGVWLKAQGVAGVLPWGSEQERASARRIAADFDGVVPQRMSLTDVAGLLAHARFAVGVDTGLSHLAGALATPAVTLYGPTLPQLTGTVGANQTHLCSDDSDRIDRDRPNTVPVARVCEALSAWLPMRAGNAVPS